MVVIEYAKLGFFYWEEEEEEEEKEEEEKDSIKRYARGGQKAGFIILASEIFVTKIKQWSTTSDPVAPTDHSFLRIPVCGNTEERSVGETLNPEMR